jgi:hypothetical protein
MKCGWHGLLLLCSAACCAQQPILITLTSQPLHTGVQRFGINLSGQTYYDSGQMLRNLIFRNPGFEGEIWQAILHCKSATATTCTDENPYAVWPQGFLAGGTYEVLSGSAAGSTGKVLATSTADDKANPQRGVSVALTPPRVSLAAGDFVAVRMEKPGSAEAGWWPSAQNGANFSTEVRDLSPRTPGKQALRMEAAAPNQSATLASYFDTLAGHSFVHLRGRYRLFFRAKALTSNARIAIKVERLDTTNGLATFLSQSILIKPAWSDYTLDFTANDRTNAQGTVALTFTIASTSILLDDVSLTPEAKPSNPTAFRDEVVQALRDFHPGMLRYMDNGTSFGSSLDNLLVPAFARQRAGYSTQNVLAEDIPIGLHEFLTLCQAIGADPWITLPPGLTTAESANLIEYLAAPAATPYGKLRAKLDHPAPWTTTFRTIHLELGNEQWNAASFPGGTINDPAAYGHRAAAVFNAARSSPYFTPQHFDLVLGTFNAVPWWTQQELAAASDAIDTVAVAPYLFASFNDFSSTEAVFGPMFAQPEQIDSTPNGIVAQQAAAASAAHKKIAVYETNLGTMSGTASQPAIDHAVPSMGAGLAVVGHMLLMLRDRGITTQNLFALPEFSNSFAASSGAKETVPLWGAVVDMGGATNRRRPVFLALQLINSAILSTELVTQTSGANPTWRQPPSCNDKIALAQAHELQSFAFADGPHRSLILLNLSRTRSLPVEITGPEAPASNDPVHQTTLTARQITDSNEQQNLVEPHSTTYSSHQTLPPFSLTILVWEK